MKKHIPLACILFCNLVSPYSFSASDENDIYSLTSALTIGSLEEENQTEIAPAGVHLKINSTQTLAKGAEVTLTLPSGKLVTGVVKRTIAERENVNLDADAKAPLQSRAYAELRQDEPAADSITVISFKDGAGALRITERDHQIVAMHLHDVSKGEIYRADIDAYGRGEFVRQDIDQYLCAEYPEPSSYDLEEIEARLPEHIPSLVDLRQLQSKPGSPRTLYLNNWGGVLTSTAWNDSYNRGQPIHYTPYSKDEDTANFSDMEKRIMWLAWREASEDYAIFDINVTTSQAVFDATPVRHRSQIISTTTRDFYPKRSGGVAYVGIFDNPSSYYRTGFTWVTSIDAGMVHSHEAGHQMGLRHDGTSYGTYYKGHGKWGPIMGAPYGKNYVQWSRGEYADANQHQDDIAIITRRLGVLADDAGDSIIAATSLPFPSWEHVGQIAPGGVADDTDVYEFTLASADTINISVKAALLADSGFKGSNLAFDVALKHSDGDIVASSASSDFFPLNTSTNRFQFIGPLEAGNYYLIIDGVSPDTDPASGFVEYGNGGQYVVTIAPNALVDIDADGIPDNLDNCPMVANPSQLNTDAQLDGGDACDLDDDNDGYSDIIERDEDTDPLDPASTPPDLDNDFLPDSTDPDIDGDWWNNDDDAFPWDASESMDTDGDGIGNNADPDDDNDGYSDQDEYTGGSNSYDASSTPADLDKDFVPDWRDADIDNDGVDNDKDAFPRDASETTDTDKDGIGNNADLDDDNDGILDEQDTAPLDPSVGDALPPVFGDIKELTIEATGSKTPLVLVEPEVTDNNLYPFTLTSDYAEPLGLGSHNILWTAVDYANNRAVKTQVIHIVDTRAPVIDDTAVESIDASGITTDISNHIGSYAIDIVDGEVPLTIANPRLKSGLHRVAVSATDGSGNVAEGYLNIKLNPQVSLLSEDVLASGSHYPLKLALSGEAAVYPVVVGYQISGAIEGAATGEVSFDRGIEQFIDINISNEARDGDEVTIRLTHAENALIGNEQQVLTVSNQNFPPQVDLVMQQAGHNTQVIDPSLGVVTVLAQVMDKNSEDIHQFSWESNDSSIQDLNLDGVDTSFEFDPANLPQQVFSLQVTVDDDNSWGPLTAKAQQDLVINRQTETLSADTDSDNDGVSDKEEGYVDSDLDGIPDYLDVEMDRSRLPIADNTAPLQTLPNLNLGLGSFVLSSCGFDCSYSALTETNIAEHGSEGMAIGNALDSHFTAASPIINYRISNLGQDAQAAVVIPLEENQSIPEQASYRILSPSGSWEAFRLDANNSIASATADSDGNCPVASSEHYVAGLNNGDNCIQLTMEDGGMNDLDHSLNGVITAVGKMAVEVVNQLPVIRLESRHEVAEGGELILDASGTQDAEGDSLSYHWQQLSGVEVNLSDVQEARLIVSAPLVSSNETVRVKLTVNDGFDTVEAIIDISIVDVKPALSLSLESDKRRYSGGGSILVSANAQGFDDDNLSYLWSQISGNSLNITDPSAKSLTLTAPMVSSDTTFMLQLTVSDGDNTLTEAIELVVNKTVAITANESGEGDSGGSLNWWLALASLLIVRRRLG